MGLVAIIRISIFAFLAHTLIFIDHQFNYILSSVSMCFHRPLIISWHAKRLRAPVACLYPASKSSVDVILGQLVTEWIGLENNLVLSLLS